MVPGVDGKVSIPSFLYSSKNRPFFDSSIKNGKKGFVTGRDSDRRFRTLPSLESGNKTTFPNDIPEESDKIVFLYGWLPVSEFKMSSKHLNFRYFKREDSCLLEGPWCY